MIMKLQTKLIAATLGLLILIRGRNQTHLMSINRILIVVELDKEVAEVTRTAANLDTTHLQVPTVIQAINHMTNLSNRFSMMLKKLIKTLKRNSKFSTATSSSLQQRKLAPNSYKSI